MFEFPESEYKWCPQCSGNIRKDASFCRFCKKAIGNKLLKNPVGSRIATIDSVSQWLPSFNSLVTKISSALRSRFEQADIDCPPATIGVPDGIDPIEYRLQNRETGVCSHEPPEPQDAGLIYDILLSVHENGESLAEICEYPHLKLMELTPQEVAAESETRKEEIEKNHKCAYCAEYVFPDDEECRFCGGTADKRPKSVDKYFDKQIDKALLKEVILFESAWRTICGTEPFEKEILEANGITQENLEAEILRQRGSDAAFPMPRFYKRMSDLKLTSYWTPESLSITSLVDLGSSLDSKKIGRSEEAMIVYQHALKRTDGKDDLMHERGRVLQYIGLLYQRKDDYVQYKKYHEMAQECQTFGMSDEMKELMRQSDLNQMKILAEDVVLDDDPEKRLAHLDKMLGGSTEFLEKMVTQMNASVPGLGEAMAALTGKLDGRMSSARLMLEAQIAKKAGDLAQAESKYTEALGLVDDDFLGASGKSDILCSIAEVKHLQGDNAAAETFLIEAVKSAADYYEAMPEFGKRSVWCTDLAFACFLRDTGKHAESEENFKRALQLQEETTNESLERYGGAKEQYSREALGIKEQFAKLLRILNRNDEAEKLELDVEQLRKEADQEDARLKEHRTKYSQHMLENLSDD